MRRLKNTRGITLIALVVTIVVLLILAAVSISMLTGENGIITQAIKSQDETEQAKVQEIVDLAVNTLISENMGSKDGITPKDIADKINEEYDQYENVYAEDEVNFPTKIIFPEEGDREVEVNLETSTGNLDEIYDADVSEEDIAPTDIFKYEIISDAETGATSFDSLPTKEARITGMNPEYCNNGGYNPETGMIEYTDTNYEIILNDGTKISDTLIIPYQVEIDGEMYKITMADIYVKIVEGFYGGLPKVKKIIYPNTIKAVYASVDIGDVYNNSTIEEIILPKSLEIIGGNAFLGCNNLSNIIIPKNVTNISKSAFFGCNNLTNIIIENGNKVYNTANNNNVIIETSTNKLIRGFKNTTIPVSVTSIGEYAFAYIDTLTNIQIPASVQNIEERAFYKCKGLKEVEISNGITSIGKYVFEYCENLLEINLPDSVIEIGIASFSRCSKLKNVKLSNNLKELPQDAFSDCRELEMIIIPESVQNIHGWAFLYCNKLTDILIKKSENSITGSPWGAPKGKTIVKWNYNE